MIDKGTYKFGNGLQGKIPPKGTDNITITYFEGGGSQGNVESKEIKVLKSFVPVIHSVINPLPAKGGIIKKIPIHLYHVVLNC